MEIVALILAVGILVVSYYYLNQISKTPTL